MAKGTRLNDTIALEKAPGPSAPAKDESLSVSTRKIDNGWITRRSHFDGEKYMETETFSEARPPIDAGKGLDPMQRAKDYMNKK